MGPKITAMLGGCVGEPASAEAPESTSSQGPCQDGYSQSEPCAPALNQSGSRGLEFRSLSDNLEGEITAVEIGIPNNAPTDPMGYDDPLADLSGLPLVFKQYGVVGSKNVLVLSELLTDANPDFQSGDNPLSRGVYSLRIRVIPFVEESPRLSFPIPENSELATSAIFDSTFRLPPIPENDIWNDYLLNPTSTIQAIRDLTSRIEVISTEEKTKLRYVEH